MKQIILFAVILVIATSTQAQKFRLLAKAGANLTKINGNSFSENFNLGYQAGGSIEFDITKKIGIQPEVIVSQTQTKTTSFNGTFTPDQNAKLDYLSIPLLLRINASKLLTIHIGPEYSILINNDKTLISNGKDAIKDGNLSMIGGLQLNLKTFRVYGRYNIGLSNINDLGSSDSWKSQQIQAGIALKIF